jgi:hypothetical protein
LAVGADQLLARFGIADIGRFFTNILNWSLLDRVARFVGNAGRSRKERFQVAVHIGWIFGVAIGYDQFCCLLWTGDCLAPKVIGVVTIPEDIVGGTVVRSDGGTALFHWDDPLLIFRQWLAGTI